METCIREALPEDETQLKKIYDLLDSYHYDALPHLFRPPDDPIATRPVARWIGDPAVRLLVAESDGQIAGFIAARVGQIGTQDPVYVPRRYAYVDDMAVLPAFRGRGIGTALLDAIERWARDQSVEGIELTVFEFNDGAQSLYERAGFQTLHRRMRKPLD